MKQYVIIGNGVAAVGCIEGIRSLDNSNKIIVVSEEKHAVYGRPLISYYLEGKTDLERMKYRSDDYYETMGCEVLYGKSVIKIDDENKTVLLDDNTVIPYDTVCVATGSRPFVPTFEGLDKVENKFSFMTLDDALALKKAISKKSNVLIVGAGLIGLKCA
ncbi:MAG: FAD-dependent oxidoreductase, partial [Bacteroidales bacterium]|nr:FAD-dependent oxidoreductase [Bacteroidales bacterium]